MLTSFKSFVSFLIGYAISTVLVLSIFSFYANRETKKYLENNQIDTESSKRYEHELADKLFEEVRILCWVFTHPDNHEKKVPHVKNVWGNKCNKLLFISIKEDPNVPEIIALPVENGRDHLWNKTKLVMEYVYKNHLNDADWFMRADDDNFILMENLRYFLYQFHPQTSLYIGSRFAIKFPNAQEGYMSGAGHIFSKKALIKFIEISMQNSTLCPQDDSVLDDVYIGVCLKNLAIFIDGHDEHAQKNFFPLSPIQHFEKSVDPNFWYTQYLWSNTTQGGLECCSDTFVAQHYTNPYELYALKYYIYNVHPFGLEKNLTETLPRKLSIDELIKLSDEKSFASNYEEHARVHLIEEDEKY